MKGFIWANVYISILLASIDASAPLQQVHQKLPHEPVPKTFGTPELLPEHGDAPIDQSHISKRSVNQQTALRTKSFGHDIPNWFKPSDQALFTDNMPVYAVSSSPSGPTYGVYQNLMKDRLNEIYTQYTSPFNNNRRKRQVDGIDIEHLINRLSPRNSFNNVKNDSVSNEEVFETQRGYYNDSKVHDFFMNETSEGSGRTKRSYTEVVYPEILVIVDYDYFKLHGKNANNVLRYLIGFWNGVDFIFRSLESPKFRLHIAGILIAQDETALSYMSKNKFSSVYFNVNGALEDSRSWLYEYLPSIIDQNSFDVAVTMTTLTMCMPTPSGQCIMGAAGLANKMGACSVDHFYRLASKSAIINDNGAFGGIQTAAHELGHTFGANHDDEAQSFPCSAASGNVMAAQFQTGANVNVWSHCSRVGIYQFLRTNGQCLYNRPKLDQVLVPVLPGSIMDANQQCEVLQGSPAFRIDAKICRELTCYSRNSGNRMLQVERYAAPGTQCGYEKICFHGQCISKASIRSAYL